MGFSLILRAGVAALAFATFPAGASGQSIVPQPTPNADALAAQMHVLGADPRNVPALIAAGELSTRLGDPAAAMAFFGRAQLIEPSNPRIAAGRAGALVLTERPGEALRLYDQAERAGVDMAPYRAQRGLAYDLIGQPGYAQREYRRALRDAPDDEVSRRLALSLGISGKREEAMTVLDPLLRKSDRAAWRARACILAIGGDVAGADRIAASMMPGGQALGPFFRKLPALSPADRAFAVHFGEVATTPTRIADARMAPVLPLLPADVVPVQPRLEVATRTEPARTERRRGRSSRRATGEPVQLALRPVQSPPAPAQAAPVATPSVAANSVVAHRTDVEQAPGTAPATISQKAPATAPQVASVAAQPTPPTYSAPAAGPPSTPAPAPSPAASPAQPSSPIRQVAAPAMRAPVVMEVIDVPGPSRVPQPAPRAITTPPTTPSPSPPARRRANEALLASIVSGIDIPVSEREDRSPTPLPKIVSKQATRVIARAETIAEPKSVSSKPEIRTGSKPGKTETKTDSKVAAKSDAKTNAKGKLPDPKAKADAKTKPDAPRWWVQIAGGARASDLNKDWKRLTEKSATLKGKGAYVTPLRATNRLLTGPFKTEAEARGVVNALAKEGKSAFTFQSGTGQKVDRLDAK